MTRLDYAMTEPITMDFTTYFRFLRKYLSPNCGKLVLLGFLVLASIGLQLWAPAILRGFIDSSIAGKPSPVLFHAAWIFLVVSILSQAVTISETYYAEELGWMTTNRIREDLIAHCLSLDMSFHKQHRPGEMIERIDGDVSELANFFSRFVVRMLGSGLLMLGLLALLARIYLGIALGLIIFVIIGAVVLRAVQARLTGKWKEVREVTADTYGFIEERLNGIEDIRSNGGVKYALRRLHPYLIKLLFKGRDAYIMGGVTWGSMIVVFTLSQAYSLTFAVCLYVHHLITVGTVYQISSYTTMLLGPIYQVAGHVQDLQQATASLIRIQNLANTESVLPNGSDLLSIQSSHSLEFDDVSFGYNGDQTVIKNLSFSLHGGHTLGLVGRTGSGKTTVTRLLFRLYDVSTGSIRVSGVDIRTIDLRDLRRHIGIVTQEVQLFDATVRDNLTFFDPSISDDQVVGVIERIGLGAWYSTLKLGLDTRLGPEGNLSAGQSQLLAIGRVLLKDPPIVILDEASSRLDIATEKLLSTAIEDLVKNRTVIIIAHRLATIQSVDDILILDSGRTAEYGRRVELMKDASSLYCKMLRSGLEEVLQ